MGNWLEERTAPLQPFRLDYDRKQVRLHENDISCADGRGNMLPLRSLARKERWQTRDVFVPNDQGMRQVSTTTRDSFHLSNRTPFQAQPTAAK